MPTSAPTNIASFTANKMLYESIQRFAIINLNDLIRVLMENIDDSLFDLSDKAKNDRDRNMYFEAMREIRLKRDHIKDSFNNELEHNFSELISQTIVLKTGTEIDELSLVDQADLEDSLAIDNMISKARPHFEDELLAISERLKAILNRKTINDDKNPLDPKSICDSFHNASEILDFDIEVKLIFYKLFDKFVMSNLGHFYAELNEFFIKKGVLVDFKAAEERANQTTQFMANRIRSNPNAQQEKQALAGSLKQQSVDTELQNLPAAEGSLLSLLQQLLTTNTQSPQSSIPMVDMNLSADNSAQKNIENSSLVGLSPAAQNPAYISALTQLQNSGSPAEVQNINTNPDDFKVHLQQQLVAFKQSNSQYTSPVDNQVIDIVSMIFDFFFEDDALPNPIKVLIGRLQIPILKVAIIDTSFFHSKKHPARQLLDHIAKESLGWVYHSKKEQVLIEKVEHIVESLLLNFDQDISVFETALEEFQQFITTEKSHCNESIDKVINNEQANDDKIIEAQNKAQQVVKKYIDQFEFSFDIIDFLEGTWKSVLYHTLLTQGEQSPHWKNIRHITSTLIWTLIVKHNDKDKRKLFKTLPALLRSLSKGLDLIKIDEAGKNTFFQMLVKEHAKIVKLSNQNIVTRIDDKTIWPEQNTEDAFAAFNKAKIEKTNIDFNLADLSGVIKDEDDSILSIDSSETLDVIHNLDEFTASIENGDIQIDDEIIMDSAPYLQTNIETNADQDDFLETAQALEIGTWVEFKVIGAETIQGKLSWKSNVTGKFVFVNRHGVKIKTISSFALAVELRSTNASLMQSSSVFDRALNSLMSSFGISD